MLDLQSALNVGDGFFFDSQDWMAQDLEMKRIALEARPDWPISSIEPGRREACIIDPLLGTSVKLISLMAEIAKLFTLSRSLEGTGMDRRGEVLSRSHTLEISLRQISLENVPLSAIMITTTSDPWGDRFPIIDTEILEEAVATSEIYRLCTTIYLFRVMHGDNVPLDPVTQEAMDQVIFFVLG
jgi:hypothetical protein